MPLTYQFQSLSPIQQSYPFNFDDDISQYAVGISSFNFTYTEDHHVQQLSLSLTVNQTGPQQISVTVNGVLSDASGHTIDVTNSYVTVVVVAWTGAATTTNLLSAAFAVGPDSQSPSINLPDSNLSVLQAGMAGFYFAYPGTDHHVLGVTAAVGSKHVGSQGYIDAQAVNMWDDSGNNAQNPTATGFLIASSDPKPSFVVKPYTAQDYTQQTIPMGMLLSDAIVLLTSFQVQFPDNDDHQIRNIGAGPNTWKVATDDKTQLSSVVSSGVWAWLGNDSGYNQDTSLSSASIVVIGIP